MSVGQAFGDFPNCFSILGMLLCAEIVLYIKLYRNILVKRKR